MIRKLAVISKWTAIVILLVYWIGSLPFVGCFGEYRICCIMSGSMEPLIQTGSLVFVKPAQEYAVGDIITYRCGETSVTHRIVKKTEEGYVTKGDANPAPDLEIIRKEHIIGRAAPLWGNTFCLPRAGYIRMVLYDCRIELILTAGGLLLVSLWAEWTDNKGRQAIIGKVKSGKQE